MGALRIDIDDALHQRLREAIAKRAPEGMTTSKAVSLSIEAQLRRWDKEANVR